MRSDASLVVMLAAITARLTPQALPKAVFDGTRQQCSGQRDPDDLDPHSLFDLILRDAFMAGVGLDSYAPYTYGTFLSSASRGRCRMLIAAPVSLDRSREEQHTYMARGAVSAARTMISLTPLLRVLVASLAPFLSCLSVEELAPSPWGERAGLDLQWLDCCTRSSISCASPVSATYSRGRVSMSRMSHVQLAHRQSPKEASAHSREPW